jgi:hypothetical protein
MWGLVEVTPLRVGKLVNVVDRSCCISNGEFQEEYAFEKSECLSIFLINLF